MLVDWYLVDGDETTGYRQALATSSRASANLRGKRGRVNFVEELTSLKSKKVGEIDAFGKPIDASRVINPSIQVIVKPSDDEGLIGFTGHFETIVGQTIAFTSRMNVRKSEIENHLTRLIGKSLNKTGYTKLLDVGLSL